MIIQLLLCISPLIFFSLQGMDKETSEKVSFGDDWKYVMNAAKGCTNSADRQRLAKLILKHRTKDYLTKDPFVCWHDYSEEGITVRIHPRQMRWRHQNGKEMTPSKRMQIFLSHFENHHKKDLKEPSLETSAKRKKDEDKEVIIVEKKSRSISEGLLEKMCEEIESLKSQVLNLQEQCKRLEERPVCACAAAKECSISVSETDVLSLLCPSPSHEKGSFV